MPDVDGARSGSLPQTPSQTVGPFFGFALPMRDGGLVVPIAHPEAIRLHGTVFDGSGTPVPDALIETWQADVHGKRPVDRGVLDRDPSGFSGFGRVPVDRDGHWSVSTLKPGSSAPGSAPFVLVTVFARGLQHHLFTRLYFGDEAEANASDPLLAAVDPARRGTLVAEWDGARSYRFDIRLQGERETVFLDYGLG